MLNRITQEELKNKLFFDEENGIFLWKVSTKKIKIGDRAGSISKNAFYEQITINYKQYRTHQLVWLYVTGVFPINKIDHEDHNRFNNRFSNLKHVDSLKNQRNRSKSKNNISGYTGVSFVKKSGKYRAYIGVLGKFISLGSFNNFSQAVSVRKSAEIKYGFHENHGL